MENVKECIKAYYEKLNDLCNKMDKQLMVPRDPRVPAEMYVGSEDSEGYIVWCIRERQEPINDKEISVGLGLELDSSLIEFINSYFFIELSGVYKEYEIEFDSITANTIISNFIERRHIKLETSEEDINLIQLGIINSEGNENLLLCLVNNTGQIVYYDYDKKEIQVIAESLNELLINLEPRC